MIYSTLIIKGNTGCSFLPQVDSNCARGREVETNEKRPGRQMHTCIALGSEIETPLYRAMRFFIENSRENKSGP